MYIYILIYFIYIIYIYIHAHFSNRFQQAAKPDSWPQRRYGLMAVQVFQPANDGSRWMTRTPVDVERGKGYEWLWCKEHVDDDEDEDEDEDDDDDDDDGIF